MSTGKGKDNHNKNSSVYKILIEENKIQNCKEPGIRIQG